MPAGDDVLVDVANQSRRRAAGPEPIGPALCATISPKGGFRISNVTVDITYSKGNRKNNLNKDSSDWQVSFITNTSTSSRFPPDHHHPSTHAGKIRQPIARSLLLLVHLPLIVGLSLPSVLCCSYTGLSPAALWSCLARCRLVEINVV